MRKKQLRIKKKKYKSQEWYNHEEAWLGLVITESK